MVKSKKGLIISTLVLIVSLLVGLFVPVKSANAYTSTPTATIDGDLWDSSANKFNENIKTLKEKLGDLYTNVSSTQSYDSQALSTKVVGDTSGLIIKLGNLTWTAVYLSQADSGDTILTLWLSDSMQLANATYTNSTSTDVSQVSNFNSGKFDSNGSATWAGWWSNSTENISPSNMYGTSFMRSVVLNNGGNFSYASSAHSGVKSTTLIDYDNKDSGSIFAPFTTDKLTDYIITPNQVSWQSVYNSTLANASYYYNYGDGNKYGYLNELIDETTTHYYHYTTHSTLNGELWNINYTKKEGYTIWGNDKLWLPSLAETGYRDGIFSSDVKGVWNTTEDMMNNTNDSWLRTGVYFDGSGVSCLESINNYGNKGSSSVEKSLSVRPALHLNLTTALASLDNSTPNTGVGLNVLSLAVSGTILFGLFAWVINMKKQKQF